MLLCGDGVEEVKALKKVGRKRGEKRRGKKEGYMECSVGHVKVQVFSQDDDVEFYSVSATPMSCK